MQGRGRSADTALTRREGGPPLVGVMLCGGERGAAAIDADAALLGTSLDYRLAARQGSRSRLLRSVRAQASWQRGRWRGGHIRRARRSASNSDARTGFRGEVYALARSKGALGASEGQVVRGDRGPQPRLSEAGRGRRGLSSELAALALQPPGNLVQVSTACSVLPTVPEAQWAPVVAWTPTTWSRTSETAAWAASSAGRSLTGGDASRAAAAAVACSSVAAWVVAANLRPLDRRECDQLVDAAVRRCSDWVRVS